MADMSLLACADLAGEKARGEKHTHTHTHKPLCGHPTALKGPLDYFGQSQPWPPARFWVLVRLHGAGDLTFELRWWHIVLGQTLCASRWPLH